MYYRRRSSDTVGCLIGCLMWIFIFIFIIGGLYNWIFGEKEPPPFDTHNIPAEIQSMNFEYDSLQKLFLMLNENTFKEKVIEYAEKNNLYYELTYHKDGIKVAKKKGVELHRYAESGDYVFIEFSRDNYKLTSASYSKYLNTSILGVSAHYIVETWGFPREYKGHYISDFSKREQGIEVKYSNGNISKTDYFKKNNAEDALKSTLRIYEAKKKYDLQYPRKEK